MPLPYSMARRISRRHCKPRDPFPIFWRPRNYGVSFGLRRAGRRPVTDFAAQGGPSRNAFIDIAQLVPRELRADEIPELRAMWWNQAALGHCLPAERGVIVIMGR